jgi:CDGSH-type Zn-finger protein
MEGEKPTIDANGDGSLKVHNLKKFKNSKGEDIEVKETMGLCRCGASENKPFCDGSHNGIGFTGKNEGGKNEDELDNYEGKEITIHDNRKICSHAAICTDKFKSVFKHGEEPWIVPDGDTKEKVMEFVRQCPSGALSYSVDGDKMEDEKREPGIEIFKDGPYNVVGGVGLKEGVEMKGQSKEKYSLCRCGASKNKPYCDGNHWDAKFKDEEN